MADVIKEFTAWSSTSPAITAQGRLILKYVKLYCIDGMMPLMDLESLSILFSSSLMAVLNIHLTVVCLTRDRSLI